MAEDPTSMDDPDGRDLDSPSGGEAPPSPEGPGAILRAARERAGKTAPDIAQALCLETRLVHAIEDDRYEAFGAGVFARGHVRRYAHSVGCDLDEVLGQWDARFGAPPPVAAPGPRTGQVRKPSPLLPIVAVAGTIVVIGALCVFVWWLLRPPSDELAAELGAEAGAGPDAAAPSLEPLGETAGSSRATAAFMPSASVAPGASGAALATAGDPAAARESRRVAAIPQAAPAGGSGATPDAEPPVLNDMAPVAAGVQRGATATAPVMAAAQAGTDTSGEVESAAAPGAAGRQPGAGADPGAVALRFVFDEECWVNVRDATGRQLMFGLREAGRIDERTGVPPISVILGRYPGVRVSVDGHRFEVPDAAVSGSVARFEISAP